MLLKILHCTGNKAGTARKGELYSEQALFAHLWSGHPGSQLWMLATGPRPEAPDTEHHCFCSPQSARSDVGVSGFMRRKPDISKTTAYEAYNGDR